MFLIAVCLFVSNLCRVACRNKRCETPLEVISSELIATEVVPSSLVKTLLYPGAFAKSLLAGSKLPNHHHLFSSYGFDHIHPASFTTDIHHLEVCFFHPSAYNNTCSPTNVIYHQSASGVCRELFMSTRSFIQPLQTRQN